MNFESASKASTELPDLRTIIVRRVALEGAIGMDSDELVGEVAEEHGFLQDHVDTEIGCMLEEGILTDAHHFVCLSVRGWMGLLSKMPEFNELAAHVDLDAKMAIAEFVVRKLIAESMVKS